MTIRAQTGFVLLASLLASTAACSSSPPPASAPACTPGETRTCVGPAACVGGQACAADGVSWSACDCGPGADANAVVAGDDADVGTGDASDAEIGPPCQAWEIRCGGSCTDLSTDAHNCGACGHDCLGATCAAKLCPPSMFQQRVEYPAGLSAFGTSVYWSSAKTSTPSAYPSGSVSSAPAIGGAATVVANYINNADAFTVFNGRTYVIAKAGSGFTSDAIDLGAVAPMLPTTLATGVGSITGLAADATGVYFTTAGSAGSVSKVGSGAAAVAVAANRVDPVGLSIVGMNLYWGEAGTGADGAIYSAPISGGATPLVTGIVGLRFVTFDATTAYWATDAAGSSNAGKIWSAPLAGGAGKVVAGGIDAPGIASGDESALCWTSRGSGASTGSVTCMRKADGSTLVLATALPHPSFLTIDAKFVYWFEEAPFAPTLGTIRRVPR